MSQINISEIKQLFDTVVLGGYCIGCGVCASIPGSPLVMKMNDCRQYIPTLTSIPIGKEIQTSALFVCPFSGVGMNEDEIAEQLFGKYATYHNSLGYHLATYGGYVVENGYRKRGSSGGMGSWILSELFDRKLIDGVIHVHKCEHLQKENRHFKYHISTSLNEINAGAKSRYYPIELSEVLQKVYDNPKRYALVGLPCFLKSVRLLAQKDNIIKKSILFYIGLVCGHLKSCRFADMFAWQVGIQPEDLDDIDFRYKLPYRKASRYGIQVTGLVSGKKETFIRPVDSFFGSPWEYGFFKYSACDFCDDVLAETADIAIGDAWLRKYNQDYEGTNVIVVRNPIFLDLIKEGIGAKSIYLDSISPDIVAKSQGGGLRHRREGLGYRLHLKYLEGEWKPRKRVLPQTDHIDGIRKKIFEYRMILAEQSHQAFMKALNVDDFSVFQKQMEPITEEYRNLYTVGRNKVVLRGRKLLTQINDTLYLSFGRKWMLKGKKIIGQIVAIRK